MQIDRVINFEIYDTPSPRHEENLVGHGVVIQWSIHNGITAPIVDEFGDLTIRTYKDGRVLIDTESMGKEHFLKVMELLYDKAEIK